MIAEQIEKQHKTFNNYVCIKLDPENDRIKLQSGFELFIVQGDKDTTVTGTVVGLPSKLTYYGEQGRGLEWLTDMELRPGDEVIVYFLSVQIALSPERQNYFVRGEDKFVFISYDKIFAKIIDGHPVPINGYCLIEPIDDPANVSISERLQKIGLVSVVEHKKKTNTHVVWGIVRYVSDPIKKYASGGSDEGIDVNVGDTVVCKKISDIPLQYELHSKVDDKKLYYRVQRRNIYAKI